MIYKKYGQIRIDLRIIADLIQNNSSVLDLGCGAGELLDILMHAKECQCHGMELLEEYICKCIEKGVPVIQSDLDEGLGDYPDNFFDYVVLSRTLHVVNKPNLLLKDMLRVGKTGIVSFPNFGFCKVRGHLFFKGTMPVTKELPYEWYDTPNIHLLTIRDFWNFCKDENIRIIKQINLGRDRKAGALATMAPNLFAEQVIFMIQNQGT